MKGVELTISTIIVIIACILVLISVIVFFFMGWDPWKNITSLNFATKNACNLLNSMGCRVGPGNISVSNFDADKDGKFDPWNGDTVSNAACASPVDSQTYDSLWSLCVCHYGIPATSEGATKCKVDICGCRE